MTSGPTGPKPRTSYMRMLEGGAGHRPVKDNPEPPQRDRLPAPPRGLGTWGSRMWRLYGKQLQDLGVLTQLDEPAFFTLCETYERYMFSKREYGKLGAVVQTTNGNLIQNPHLGIMSTAIKQMTGLFALFGMTPTDRARLDIPDQATKQSHEWFFGGRQT